MKRLTVFSFIIFCLTQIGTAQIYKNPEAATEDRVDDFLSRMTLDEKIDYIGGYNGFYIRAIPRLGMPEIKLTDGPVGTHKDGKSTAYPAGVTTASTWNKSLVYELGRQLGRDSRARGVHILLGPGINILRAPMCGRNFEYFTEDPYLNAETACAYVSGLQDQRVAATLKHYAANNQEWDRNNVSSDIDERVLHEIYLPAFKAAIQKAGAACVMDSYNLINGVHATQNDYLNNHVLRRMWGFDGIVMSDWSATYDAVEAANGGLDLEMPRAKWMNTKYLIPAIENGSVEIETINEKVRRILRVIFKFGFFDNPQLDSTIPLDNPDGAKVALEIAREGIVLLKNDNNILPIKDKDLKIAVIGPNANSYISGGGSSYTFPFHSVSLLDGLRSMKSESNQLTYSPGLPTLPETVAASIFYTDKGSSTKGLKAEYFNNPRLKGSPEYTRIDSIVNIANGYHIATENRGLPYDHCSIRWTGVIRPDKDADYRFLVRGFDGFRLFIDDKPVINEWRDQGITMRETVLSLKAGEEYPVILEYFANVHPVDISFGWREDKNLFAEAAEIASNADIAIVSVGFNESLERESNDRPFDLPEFQDELIKTVIAANPNTVVLLNAGSNVNMSQWQNDVKGIVYLGYPGQEGGTAAAEIIFGKINPSGKLPVTFEKKWEDNPAAPYYYDSDGDKRVEYGEGLYLGYRHFDSHNVKPSYAFGFGKSYSDFEFSNLKVKKTGNRSDIGYEVSFDVKNIGKMDGKETAQLYIRPINPKVDRPYKELKAYDKQMIKAGKKVKFYMTIDKDAFSYYDSTIHNFKFDDGEYEILIGNSSDNTPLHKTIQIK